MFDDFGRPKIGVAEAPFARRIRFFGSGPMNEVGRGAIIEPALETSCIEIVLIAYTQDKGITDIVTSVTVMFLRFIKSISPIN